MCLQYIVLFPPNPPPGGFARTSLRDTLRRHQDKRTNSAARITRAQRKTRANMLGSSPPIWRFLSNIFAQRASNSFYSSPTETEISRATAYSGTTSQFKRCSYTVPEVYPSKLVFLMTACMIGRDATGTTLN